MLEKQEHLIDPKAEGSAIDEFWKGMLHEELERPYNGIIGAINHLTGIDLPKLNITGLDDRPHLPVNYIKAEE